MNEEFDTQQIINRIPGPEAQQRATRSLPKVREEAISYGSQKAIQQDNLKQILLYLDEKGAGIDDFGRLLDDVYKLPVVEVEGVERFGTDSDRAFANAAEALKVTNTETLVDSVRNLANLDKEVMMRNALLTASVETPTLWSEGTPMMEVDLGNQWMQTSLSQSIDKQISRKSLEEGYIEYLVKYNPVTLSYTIAKGLLTDEAFPQTLEKTGFLRKNRTTLPYSCLI